MLNREIEGIKRDGSKRKSKTERVSFVQSFPWALASDSPCTKMHGPPRMTLSWTSCGWDDSHSSRKSEQEDRIGNKRSKRKIGDKRRCSTFRSIKDIPSVASRRVLETVSNSKMDYSLNSSPSAPGCSQMKGIPSSKSPVFTIGKETAGGVMTERLCSSSKRFKAGWRFRLKNSFEKRKRWASGF